MWKRSAMLSPAELRMGLKCIGLHGMTLPSTKAWKEFRTITSKTQSMQALQELGYTYANDRLVTVDGKPFEFEVKRGDQAFNQLNYERVGDATTLYIEEMLQSQYGLQKVTIPIDATPNELTSEIYMSPDALTSSKALLVLVPGISIKVGQWARKIVINESLYRGSMFEYIHLGMDAGYNIMVLNSNKNGTTRGVIRGNDHPERHVQYVWTTFLKGCATNTIHFVAHSFGGQCIASAVG
ncbi:Arb2 domain-containing protein [Chytridium lagenaria]|nr:Arb2 domain-containing protein [Chytridium lagenaria]